MRPLEILIADHAKNHSGRAYSVEDQLRQIAAAKLPPLSISAHGDCLFLWRVDGPYSVEFHSIVGSDGRALTRDLAAFLKDMAETFAFATTFYDNPKINALVQFMNFPGEVAKIDDGRDRTYRLRFDMRSA